MPTKDEQHPIYFFEDGGVTLRLDRTLFCLHKSRICASELIRNTLKDARGIGPVISLDSVPSTPQVGYSLKKDSFVDFLSFIYPTPGSWKQTRTDEQWIALFKVAHFLQAHDVKECAEENIAKSSKISTTEKLQLVHEYDAQTLLEQVFLELSMRPRPLSDAEASMLSHRQLVLVTRLREEVRRGLSNIDQWTNWMCCDESCRKRFRICLTELPKQALKDESIAAKLQRERKEQSRLSRTYCCDPERFPAVFEAVLKHQMNEWREEAQTYLEEGKNELTSS